jgi:nucleoid-associated protein YgaU
MHLTDNSELTDAQTRDLVRRGVAKGRRMNATRRAVSGVAALAVVGALSVGAFNVVGALSPDTNVAPAAPQAPSSPPAESPGSPDPKDVTQRRPSTRGSEMLASSLLKPTLVDQLPEGSTVKIPKDPSKADHSAIAKVPTEDGYVTVKVGLLDWRNDQRLSDWGFAQPVDGHENVWFVPGAYDGKQGEDSWYLQREDGAVAWFRVLTVKRVGDDGKKIASTSSTSPFEVAEVAALLDTADWDLILDEAMPS